MRAGLHLFLVFPLVKTSGNEHYAGSTHPGAAQCIIVCAVSVLSSLPVRADLVAGPIVMVLALLVVLGAHLHILSNAIVSCGISAYEL